MRLILLSTVVALGRTAHAEQPAIDEAQLLARVAADPRLARIAADVDLAAAEAVAVRTRPNPTLAIEREEVFPDGGIATNYLRLQVPLELSGRRSLRATAARSEAAAVASDGERTRFAIEIAALRTFRSAAYARLRVDLLVAERAALVRAVEIVRKRTTAGTASGYDLQRVELELAVYDDQIVAGQTQLAAARAELGALVGQPSGVDATDPFALPSDPPAADTLIVVDNHPAVRAAAIRIDGAAALARAGARAKVPDIALSAGVMLQDVGDATAKGYTAGLFVDLPLFDRGQADRARASAQTRAARADRDVLVRALPAAIRTAHATLSGTLARARDIGTRQVARLDQLLRSAETAYRDGGGNVVELVDAHRTARDTRLRELELRRDARLAELELWLALGRRLGRTP